MSWTPTKPRRPIAAAYNGPGPSVLLPPCLGNKTAVNKNMKPCYTFGVRHAKFTDDCSPGPCHFVNPKITRKGQDGEPHYSLYSRSNELARFKTPGPGAYSPEQAGQGSHYHAPCYSLGSRTKGNKFDKSPAPNSYSLPGILGGKSCCTKAYPVYSITGRSKIGSFDEDLQRTPGPGTYSVTNPSVYKTKRPMYSMTGRNQLPSDGTRKPGPGAHSPEKVTITKGKAASHSFGIRHSEYICPLINDTSE